MPVGYCNIVLLTAILEMLEGTARITEARLNREQSEGKILAYERVKDLGYKVIPHEAINCKEAKVIITAFVIA